MWLKIILKINCDPYHPLYHLPPKVKVTSYELREPSFARPKLNSERFKDSFFNRLNFKYNLVI